MPPDAMAAGRPTAATVVAMLKSLFLAASAASSCRGAVPMLFIISRDQLDLQIPPMFSSIPTMPTAVNALEAGQRIMGRVKDKGQCCLWAKREPPADCVVANRRCVTHHQASSSSGLETNRQPAHQTSVGIDISWVE
ncbi:hypothetical protein CLCR_02158 [Cladophialophora carrionii]|uniref:Secreted protein n=1 Tax=Cladophialophora carrionii TaxID=86049 RepID=A0A1C1CDZ2_9EURO|nr:hypothetical protein CLCR_02158 [Cladophialophora carrionii]